MGNCFPDSQLEQMNNAVVERQVNSRKYRNFSSLYMACRDGNYDLLLRLWPLLTYSEINHIEKNGNTALHAACYNNHINCIRVLVVWGCDTNILNKYGRTAFEQIRNQNLLFTVNKTDNGNNYSFTNDVKSELETFLESGEWIPNNSFIRGYKTIKDINDVKKMIANYRSNSGKTAAMSADVEKGFYVQIHLLLFRRMLNDNPHYNRVKKCLIEHNIIALIELYRSDVQFSKMLKEDNVTFLKLILLHLSKYRNRAFQGSSYCRITKMPLFDLYSYKWASKQEDRVVENRSFIFSTASQRLVKKLDQISAVPHEINVQINYIFPGECDTAIFLNKLPGKKLLPVSSKEYDYEVLILPYTLFKVQSINIDESTQKGDVTLLNIPILT